MAILLPGKFIYLCTPCTNSLEVTNALKTIPGAINVQDKAWGVGHHATLQQVKDTEPTKTVGNEKVFAFIRNPYDLIVQWYKLEKDRSNMKALGRSLQRKPSFYDFVVAWAEHEIDPYIRKGVIFYHANEADIICRYEKGVENEVNSVLRKMGEVPQVQISLNAEENDDHWSLYYDKKTYEAVNTFFQKDFIKYGYSFIRE